MERIRVSNLVAGQVFTQTLFSSTGQKLLQRGTPINEHHIAAVRRAGEFEVLLASSVDELASAGVIQHVDSSKLRVGEKSRGQVLSKSGTVLVDAGQEIEEHHLDALHAAGDEAYLNDSDENKQNRARIELADSLVAQLEAEARNLDLRVQGSTGPTWLQPQAAELWPNPQELTRLRNTAVESLRNIYARLEAGLPVLLEEFEPILDDLISYLRSHPCQFTQLALLCPRRQDYLPDHAYTTTVLAMATAARLNWTMDQTRTVGLAGLMYDLGMLMVPERIRSGASELTDVDRARVNRHPIFSLALIQNIEGVPVMVRLAALQHHEKENGSGYPRGLRKDHACDYARVIAIVDAFAAATESRHYRSKKLPYIAMEETVRTASAGTLWKPAARALVQAAGLFPVGSYVKLSNGCSGHIVSAHPTLLDRPMVQPLDALGNARGEIINLADKASATITIVRPLPGPVE